MTLQNAKVYDIINSKAESNTAMQGISGLMGFPFRLYQVCAQKLYRG